MAVLTTIQVTLKDEKAEKLFLETFTKGTKSLDKVKGLISLSAWKQLGPERTYMAFALWEDENSIETWRKTDMERKNIELGKKELLAAYTVQRYKAIGEPRKWSLGDK